MAANEQKENRISDSCASTSGHNKVVEINYHPSFSSSEADIVLRSSDGVLYRVYSYTLRVTTGLFRTMFSLPQPQRSILELQDGCTNGNDGGVENLSVGVTTEFIPVHETSEILTLFLTLLSGKPINKPMSAWGDFSPNSAEIGTTLIGRESQTQTYDVIERVLFLAENWDAPGPISFIRTGMTSPELLSWDPLRLYAIASHFGWEAERALAARYTLRLDLFEDGLDSGKGSNTVTGGHSSDSDSITPIHLTLSRLSSKDLLSVIKLRHSRREKFRTLINNSERFAAGNTDDYLCSRCGVSILDNSSWRSLKEAMIVEIDRRPLGDSIIGRAVNGVDCHGGPGSHSRTGLGLGVVSWPEAEVCWKAKCVKDDCGGLNYDKYATLRQIQLCVDALPWDLS